jgi:hypothetical protein
VVARERLWQLSLALGWAVLLFKAASTLSWRLDHDAALLHFAAFQMDAFGAVPYRDLFETSFPGTFAFHYAVGHVFGFSDLAFRCVDLALLALLSGMTFRFMRRFGSYAAAAAPLCFGFIYFSFGQSMSLQRDYLGLLPVAAALLALPAGSGEPRRRAFAAAGVWFGLAATIKPHLAVGWPILVVALQSLRRPEHGRRDAVWNTLAAAGGLALPLTAAAAWLASVDALEPFLRMVRDYLPLHNNLTGMRETLGAGERLPYLLRSTVRLGGYAPLALSAVAALALAYRRPQPEKAGRVSLHAVAALTAATALYPAFAGKFWDYHYMPFAYAASLAAALSVAPHAARFLPLLFAAALTLQAQLPRATYAAYKDVFTDNARNHAPKYGRVDEIAGWLRERLRPGDTVQPLDWSGGAVHAMLLAKARLGTRFVYDYHFYHHVSAPAIQGLRAEFLAALQAAPPRFVIEVVSLRSRVGGADTTADFPALKVFLRENFTAAHRGSGYTIWEYRGSRR